MLTLMIDGVNVEFAQQVIDDLLKIEITPFNADFWNNEHAETICSDVDFKIDDKFYCCTFNCNKADGQKEVHQIDCKDVHLFALSPVRFHAFYGAYKRTRQALMIKD